MMQGFFFRQRDVAPGAGTATVTARARVEPLGSAPGQEASGTATVTAVARVEPVGAIPPVPSAPSGNAIEFDHTVDFQGFIAAVDGTAAQAWSNNDPGDTDTIRAQEATNAGFSSGLEEQELGGGATGATWPNHKDGVTRFYRVRAENGSGASSWSNTVSVKHIEDVPGVPTNPGSTSPTSTSITVTWDAPAVGGPVDHYIVEFTGFPDRESADTTETFGGLDPATAYTFRVRPIGPDNQRGDLLVFPQQATRHPTPGLTGCVNTPNPLKPGITQDRLLIADNATENTNIRVYRNGDPYTLIGDGTQGYTPAPQTGSWHVTATGGTTGGGVSIPESLPSPTRTMPFEDPCTPP